MSDTALSEYHHRVAARLRSLLGIARAPAFLRLQIARKAEKHERLARVAEHGSLRKHAAD